jgi:hypothetical protein
MAHPAGAAPVPGLAAARTLAINTVNISVTVLIAQMRAVPSTGPARAAGEDRLGLYDRALRQVGGTYPPNVALVKG